MQERISPAGAVRGSVHLPGDKSISHRYGILSAIAEGASLIRNYSTGADCQSTLGAVRALGIAIDRQDGAVCIHGAGLTGLRQPAATLEAGNSGSTMRMLSGVLAAQSFVSRIAGDASLSRRPMDRIIKPLGEMGAVIHARDGRYPPLQIDGRPLRAIRYTLPVASAQVKSCVLFAGLFAEGVTSVTEPVRTRDHTEIALREFGAEVECRNRVITVKGRPSLAGRELTVPGDISSAAFFLAGALIVPGSNLVLRNIGLNPTRAALIDLLLSMGARVRVLNISQSAGELVGDLAVQASPIRGGVVEKDIAAAVIDEIPVLAVLGAASEEGLLVRDAAELRVKETDRIATVAENLHRMGISVEVHPDGFQIPGRQHFRAAQLDSFGDHRVAMAFSIAALAADGDCLIDNAEAASVSYPQFFDTLRELTE
jgi:3-phosphoshikimate 1-carboxyvinyltransferase